LQAEPPNRGQGIILLVDDDHSLRRALHVTLSGLGFTIVGASRGEEALSLIQVTRFDAVLLDVDIPGIGGIETCRSIRTASAHLPILMLTAMEGEDAMVSALDAGADDYITKPFRLNELTARLRAAVRRRNSRDGNDNDSAIRHGDLELDPVKYRVQKSGRTIHVSPKEFEMLRYLMSHPRELIPRERLLSSIWGENCKEDFVYLRIYVCQLRKKIEDDPLSPKYILTVPSVGYKFNTPSAGG
jgi:two-component system, OmpR family, KDP operon response regulator KdpE